MASEALAESAMSCSVEHEMERLFCTAWMNTVGSSASPTATSKKYPREKEWETLTSMAMVSAYDCANAYISSTHCRKVDLARSRKLLTPGRMAKHSYMPRGGYYRW